MKSSIGTESLNDQPDADHDGAPDQSEAEFGQDGEVVAQPGDRPEDRHSPRSHSTKPAESDSAEPLGPVGGPGRTVAP